MNFLSVSKVIVVLLQKILNPLEFLISHENTVRAGMIQLYDLSAATIAQHTSKLSRLHM